MKEIEIYKASQNNLKNLDVKIPLHSMTIICGLSGSGKSSLAFETVYAEGQRRYLQSLPNYVNQYIDKQIQPHVDEIKNLPPALALEQKNTSRSRRSTVATLSNLSDYLRLLFEKLGEPLCPKHKTPLYQFSPSFVKDFLMKNMEGENAYILSLVERDKIQNEQDFLKSLQKASLLRIVSLNEKNLKKPKIKLLEEIKKLPKKNFFILIDRLTINDANKDRIVDSLNQAFECEKLIKNNLSFYLPKKISILSVSGKLFHFSSKKTCSHCEYEFPFPITHSLFNFNSPIGACPLCEGYGSSLEIDEKKIIPFPKKTLKDNAVYPFSMASARSWKTKFFKYCKEQKINLDTPWCDLSLKQRNAIFNGTKDFKGVKGYFASLERKKYKMHIRILLARYRSPFTCKLCKGSRLKKEVGSIYIKEKNFFNYMEMTIGELKDFFESQNWTKFEKEKAKDILSGLKKNLYYLDFIGLSYLHLNRFVSSLSGGEFQRLNLTNQLGSALSQVLYVLDEPTIGLHPRDVSKMVLLLKELKKLGNTVLVVEHDPEMIKQSDFIIEMGPGSGERGGEVLWFGKPKDFALSKKSNTSFYLNRKQMILKNFRPVNIKEYKYKLKLKNCSGYNLKNLDLEVPLNRFVLITGVSGSGKSNLIVKTLFPALDNKLNGSNHPVLDLESIRGEKYLKKVILMDQSNIRHTSRSNPISYIKVYDSIRNIFAETELAKKKNFSSSYFSLNVDKGRCSNCKGLGFEEIDMVFMDPISITCDECKGKKFKKEVLEIKYKGKNISEVLNLSIEEAIKFFPHQSSLVRGFRALQEVGLSYVSLGQSIGSLSGGEKQRLKLAKELLNSDQKKTLYILDEPTKGLHFKEIQVLIRVLNRLIDGGGSLIVIEHNLEMIREADYIIDIGPEAGAEGGKIVSQGDIFHILKSKKSHISKYLKEYLKM